MGTATDFDFINWQEGFRTSNMMHEYAYDDASVKSDIIYYYRLKQIDFNGEEKFSTIIAAKITNDNAVDFLIAENPIQQSTTISYYISEDSQIRIVLNDVTGKRIQLLKNETETRGEHFLTLDKSSLNLPRGIY